MNINKSKIKELVKEYTTVVKVVDIDAHNNNERAYGGVVRSVKGKFVLGIECKAYTENAMLKRILVDKEFI